MSVAGGTFALMADIAWQAVDTPLGAFTVATTDEGVVSVGFRSHRPHAVEGGAVRPGTDADEVLTTAVAQIAAWAAGAPTTFTVPIDWTLTSGVQRDVLQLLYETVPYGETIGYGQLADKAGLPAGARLVGQIMGSNPIPVIVPCHRVLAADGIGGYGPGVELKRRILVLEGVLQPSLFD
jgi:methylated-DNA-[protein]-cysteine S-methyltransferase